MWTAKERNPLCVQTSELQRWAIGSLACTQVIMSDIGVKEEVIIIDIKSEVIMSNIGVKEEVIIIDIKSDIADDSNINVAPRGGAGSDPLDGNGNDDAAVGGC